MFFVFSVGISADGYPLVTINGENEKICYKLPIQLQEWAMTVVGMAMFGERLFPSEVIFTKNGNKYYADIL